MKAKTWLIIGGMAILGVTGWTVYKYNVPPTFTILSINPLDGSGQFTWGKAGGALGPGTFSAGWGWTGTLTGFVPGTGWTLQVFKNGVLYKQLMVSMVNPIKI